MTPLLRGLSAALCAWLLAWTPSSQVGSPQAAPDAIAPLLQRLEQVVGSGDPAAYRNLLAPNADVKAADAFARWAIQKGVTRVTVRERDRMALPGTARGAGFRLAVDVFTEVGHRGLLATWQLDVVRQAVSDSNRSTATAASGANASSEEWRIKAQDRISSFGGLYNLSIGPRQYAVKDLVLSAEDFELRLPGGSAFVAETDDGPTVLVLLGRGEMSFHPTPATEREQTKIFAGSETITTSFTSAFVRVSPYTLQAHVKRGTMIERPGDGRDARTAADLFREDNPKSFCVNLGDLTTATWSLVPGPEDFLAEVHTRRFGVLTYARSNHEAEDITVFDRAQKRNISVYASQAKIARRGFFYSEDEGQDYSLIHYDIDASIDPGKQTLEGVARLTAEIRAPAVNAITLKLAESLDIVSVVSREFGRLFAIRIRNQNSFILNLPKSPPKGAILGFTITYRGRLAPAAVDREAVALDAPQDRPQEEQEPPPVLLEPSYLYSNRSFWYPQGETTSFATATVRVKVPPNYACVASGDPSPATEESLAKMRAAGTELEFSAPQPVRYLSLLIARLLPVKSLTVNVRPEEGAGGSDAVQRAGVFYREVQLTSFAAPRLRSRTLTLTDRAGDILRFYSSLMGDCPYPTLTLAVVERQLPGGHSPGYLAVISQPVLSTPYDWRSDPTNFADFPEFFVAHEIAHQWWGQAIGWKNYHEQWLSEGLSQYFAALYAERLRGRDVFDGIIERMQDWAIEKSDQGPVYLGYRIGHVKRDPQLFRAIVYNKSAAVLHMLRRLLGDEAFFGGLRRFYQKWRFEKAGSDDLRQSMEQVSGRPLKRFFERWIYDSRIPRLKFSSRTERDASGGSSVVVRFEQTGDVFDVPVLVTLEYADRTNADILVPVTEAVTEMRVPLKGKLRGIEVDRDHAAVARIDR